VASVSKFSDLMAFLSNKIELRLLKA